ncbi:hypothetical protein L2E82_30729 [Cichorium intybus]|uniref:Uncharacterized protein n=1 Tax=Cichorium intybus TaxID=13427 RepID=A0ACB9D1E9_CICIN|nr:hypothetical protein L2E82_30729 [Cichorium intybus]
MGSFYNLFFTVDNAELLPLMEGEGRAFRVMKKLNYGTLFLSHISEGITDAATFSENQTSPLFTDDIIYRYRGLRGLKFWKEEHDRTLLRAVLKHGYGRWQAIVDDKDLRVQEVICQELNLPGVKDDCPRARGISTSVNPPGNLESQSQTPIPGGGGASQPPQDTTTAANRRATGCSIIGCSSGMWFDFRSLILWL